MVDSGRKKTFIDKLLFAFKPKKCRTDIVEYAEKILDDYTGMTSLRIRRKARQRKTAIITSITLAITIFILCCTLKIFF